MATIAEAVIKLELENKELKAKLGESITAVEGFKGKMVSVGEFIKSNWLAITAVVAGLTIAIRKVVSVVSDWVQQAMEAQRVENLLASALAKQTKNYQAVTNSMKEYAQKLAQTTRFSDEEYLQVMAKMVSRGMDYADVLKSISAVSDLAVGGQLDLSTASRLVMMAYNGNTEALRRYQINVTSTGDKTKDFNIVLEQIRKNMGGMAMGEATTLAGKMIILKNNIDEAKESLGNQLLPSIDKAITAFNKWITDSNNLNTLIDLLILVVKAFGWVAKAVVGVLAVAQLLYNGWKLQFELMADVVLLLGKSVGDVFKGVVNTVKDSFLSLRNNMLEFLLNPFGAIGKAVVKNTVDVFKDIGKNVKDSFGKGKDSIEKFGKDSIRVIEDTNRIIQGIDTLTNLKRQENSNATTSVVVSNEEEIQEASENTVKMWTTSMGVMATAFQDEFVKNVGASLNDLNLNFNRIFENIYRGFLNLLAEMASKAIAFGLLNWITGGAFGLAVGGIEKILFKNKGGYIKKYAGGGTVHGGSGIDTVPAMLTAGEFVVNKPATAMFRPMLESMNNAGRKNMAFGGSVDKMNKVINIQAPIDARGAYITGDFNQRQWAKSIADALKKNGAI